MDVILAFFWLALGVIELWGWHAAVEVLIAIAFG